MKISIDGTTLRSLRKRYKASIETAAYMAKVEPEEFSSWESDGVELSLTDAKKLARVFHTHWSVFLLRSEVQAIKEPINHRAGYNNDSPFSMSTLRAYEVARRLLDVSNEIDGQTVDTRMQAIKRLGQTGEKPQVLADKVREILGVDVESLKHVKSDGYSVYKFWKDRVAAAGIYVSEQEMPEEETKAFLLEDKNRAVIVVNKKDRYIFSRVFSLLHELGHMVKGESSAACKVNVTATRMSKEETWCNRFASELAAPDDQVIADRFVAELKVAEDPAAIIRRLASKYRISFTVTLYKLCKYDLITPKQCAEMYSFFESVIMPKYQPERSSSKEIKLGRSYYVGRDISRVSLSLSREVIERQMHGDISYSEAARLLNTKAKYIADIKERVGFGQ